ncbi:HIT family protein [Streptococcus sp. H31]|uniref:HIT family protein n=1 Tax=Streptococcus huangxiaojuni TaxID=3237239 RepID=UPI0034A34C4E
MCLICERIDWIKKGKNQYFVKEFETGYVVSGDYQYFKGYTLFLCKCHVSDLHDLSQPFRDRHLSEMALVSGAVSSAFSADKMNIESLGNGENHLHWHLFPRKKGDLGRYGQQGRGPVWWLPFDKMYAEHVRPTALELKELKEKLLETL